MRALFRILVSAITLGLGLAACERQGPPAPAAPEQDRLIVFAAASTTDVMREAGRRFQAATGSDVTFSFDASSGLARQIKARAAADVFLSADKRWMDDVAAAGAIRPETREDLLANELVLIAPVERPFVVEMDRTFDFARELPGVKRIAVGDPAHVPAGRYARQALESLGWWEHVRPRLLQALDVRAALRLVELGEADAGVVYATDARATKKAVVVAAFPPETHEPIHYPIAICTGGSAPAAAADFVRFLRRPEVIEVFERAGFRVLGAGASGGGGGGGGG